MATPVKWLLDGTGGGQPDPTDTSLDGPNEPQAVPSGADGADIPPGKLGLPDPGPQPPISGPPLGDKAMAWLNALSDAPASDPGRPSVQPGGDPPDPIVAEILTRKLHGGDPLAALIDGLDAFANDKVGALQGGAGPIAAILSNGLNADAGVAQLVSALASIIDGKSGFDATLFAPPGDPSPHGVIAPAQT
jgi:hypothetical protein